MYASSGSRRHRDYHVSLRVSHITLIYKILTLLPSPTYSQHYLIFGMGDGSIRVNRTKEDFRDLNEYFTLNMHYNLNGKVSGLAFSNDNRYLFSVGTDGNLFAYKWYSSTAPTAPPKPKSQEMPIPCVEDIEDPTFLSLEQQKIKQENDRKAKLLNDQKNDILNTVADYRKQFEQILARNLALPESQRFTMEDFTLDERITADLKQELEEKMDLVRRKTAFDVEKARLSGEKLRKFFLEEMEHAPIEVLGVR